MKAFTLIELTLVILIIGIMLGVITQLNWGKIDAIDALNEREQRLSRHNKRNTLFTSTNYRQGEKIDTDSELQFVYNTSGVTLQIEKHNQDELNITIVDRFKFQKQTLSGDLIITKQPLQLGCTTNNEGEVTQGLMIIAPRNNILSFNLDSTLCARKNTKK